MNPGHAPANPEPYLYGASAVLGVGLGLIAMAAESAARMRRERLRPAQSRVLAQHERALERQLADYRRAVATLQEMLAESRAEVDHARATLLGRIDEQAELVAELTAQRATLIESVEELADVNVRIIDGRLIREPR